MDFSLTIYPRPETFKVRSAGRNKKELFNADDIAYFDRVIDDLFLHKDHPDYRECLGRPTPLKAALQTAQA